MSILARISNFAKDEQGVTAIEYAIVVAGVAAVVMVIFGTDKNSPVNKMLTDIFTNLNTKLVGTINGSGAAGTP